GREAGRDDVALLDKNLRVAPDVPSPGVQSLGVGRFRHRQNGSRYGPTVAILVSNPACEEGASARAVVPEETWPYDPACISCQVGPAVAVDIFPLLPIPAAA